LRGDGRTALVLAWIGGLLALFIVVKLILLAFGLG
jgi:hypothetical protein